MQKSVVSQINAPEWLEQLSTIRREFVASSRANKFEDGIRQSTVEKYAEPEHFIYELLQNAEDQNATDVSFELKKDRLLFRHNGDPFTQANVESITGIGNSSKPDQIDKIGRFGIGFKSVFIISDRPEIYTKLEGMPFAFAIEDLVVPVPLPVVEQPTGSGQTCFVFPFKPGSVEDFYQIIAYKLATLGADTLLFLTHLHTIEWQTEEEKGDYLCSTGNRGNGNCKLASSITYGDQTTQEEEAEYRVFSKSQTGVSSDSRLSVRIAFRLKDKRIVPEASPLSVYFPTQEQTGLKFRLHAPMLLTDNRANIKRNNEVNTVLVNEAAELLAESLPRLRNLGYVDPDFLNCLPIQEDAFPSSSPFRPLYDKTRDALLKLPLLPTSDGRYIVASEAKIARVVDLRSLLTNDQLTQLFGGKFAWLHEDITIDKMGVLVSYLRNEIKVGYMDSEAIPGLLSKDFLAQQNDDWMARFYRFIHHSLWGGATSQSMLKRRPFIRTERGEHIVPFLDDGRPGAYLPPQGETEYVVVKRAIAVDADAHKFLVEIGFKLPDDTALVLETLVPQYRRGDYPEDLQDYRHHISLFASMVTSTAVCNQLKITPFVRCINASDPKLFSWRTPSDAYIHTQEIETWFEGNPDAWFVAPELTNHPNWADIRKAMPFKGSLSVKALPVQSDGNVILERQYFGRRHHRRGLDGFDPDATLEGIEFALKAMTFDKAKLLWNLLLENIPRIFGTVECATHQTFNNINRQMTDEMWSHMGQACRAAEWLPDAHKRFMNPASAVLEDVHPDFRPNTDQARRLAKALGMKVIDRSEAEELAEKVGVRLEDLDLIRKHPAAFKQFVMKWKKKPFPQKSSPNLERRAAKIVQRMEEAPEKEYEKRPRSIRTSSPEVAGDKQTFLQETYTDEDGDLFCQVCENVMPFKLPGGSYYFESVELLKIDKEHQENAIALCPTCAAKFKYARSQTPADMAEHIRENEQPLIPVCLAGEQQTIRFTETHYHDLRTILRALGEQ